MILRKKRKYPNIDPDEIFMDSKNISGFDTQQFEGRMEKPVKRKTFLSAGIVFLIIGLAIIGQTFYLQIVKGESYLSRSENNRLKLTPIFPERGIVYDRNGEKLAWNAFSFRAIEDFGDGKELILKTFYNLGQAQSFLGEKKITNANKNILEIEPTSSRYYINTPGFGHVLGYIGFPSQKDMENKSPVLREAMIGKDGIEKKYEDALKGEIGLKMKEVDSLGRIESENMQINPIAGNEIKTAIDLRIQGAFFKFIKSVADERGFEGGAGIMLDVNNGEILSLISYPEYDPQILSRGEPKEEIKRFISDSRKPFLNRVVSGLYAPGSIVKPFVAIAALNEKIISPNKQIFSSGSISIPNPYFPDKKSVFYDWKAHGLVDMRKALAVSSDVYFYEIGGGFEDIKGLGINKIIEYAKMFGMAAKTGIDLSSEEIGLIPGPDWKKGATPDDPVWRIGDTYNASIGQGAFQVTPIQMAVFTAAVANNGKLIQPHLVLENQTKKPLSVINIQQEYFQIVKEGMRMAVTEGTASALNISSIKIAAKTGTAQVGITKKHVNSWIIGFFPYEEPKYAFVIVMEKGPASNLVGAASVGRQLFDWMSVNTKEYMLK